MRHRKGDVLPLRGRDEAHGNRIRPHQRATWYRTTGLQRCAHLPHVTDATVLFGDHDLIVKLEANDLATIAKAVVEHIRAVEGVVNTKTLAGADLQ